jgi:hypothetical protein
MAEWALYQKSYGGSLRFRTGFGGERSGKQPSTALENTEDAPRITGSPHQAFTVPEVLTCLPSDCPMGMSALSGAQGT